MFRFESERLSEYFRISICITASTARSLTLYWRTAYKSPGKSVPRNQIVPVLYSDVLSTSTYEIKNSRFHRIHSLAALFQRSTLYFRTASGTETNRGLEWYQSKAYDLPLFWWVFKLPSLFKKQKLVFSVNRHIVIEWSVNVETAVNVCGSGALQAAITVIAACVVPLLLL
jgi:hypothetical protein